MNLKKIIVSISKIVFAIVLLIVAFFVYLFFSGGIEFSKFNRTEEQNCIKKGGQYRMYLLGDEYYCSFPTRDGGKSCQKDEDCENQCQKDKDGMGICTSYDLR